MSEEFDKTFLVKQKELLLEHKNRILNGLQSTEGIQMNQEDLAEDGDLCQAIMDQNYAISLKERDVRRLREIELALQRIEDGTYGHCEESGELIGKNRLTKIPWTRLSIESAEQLEKNHRFRRAM